MTAFAAVEDTWPLDASQQLQLFLPFTADGFTVATFMVHHLHAAANQGEYPVSHSYACIHGGSEESKVSKEVSK